MEEKRRGLLLVMIDVDPEDEEELNRWYNEEHIQERASCPGFLTIRRFMSVKGKPKYLALYELESPDVLESPQYKHDSLNPTEWTQRIFKRFKASVRNVYVEITPENTFEE